MALITNSGITMITKIAKDKGLVVIGFNPDGTEPVRVCEDGENIMEFSSWDAYDEWIKENRPGERCPDNNLTVRTLATFATNNDITIPVRELGLFPPSPDHAVLDIPEPLIQTISIGKELAGVDVESWKCPICKATREYTYNLREPPCRLCGAKLQLSIWRYSMTAKGFINHLMSVE